MLTCTAEQEQDDVNIWMETEDLLIQDKDNQSLDDLKLIEEDEENIKAGSLNKLVEKLTAEDRVGMSCCSFHLLKDLT
jgi:hypothetical protein